MLSRLRRNQDEPKNPETPRRSGIDILIDSHPWKMSAEERAAMTISCRDTNYIPKVPKAGKRMRYRGKNTQLMHNGLYVVDGGYHGDWMADIIETLKGHHEPQEEKAFYEVVERLKKESKRKHYMMELGAFWAYYSLWFKKSLPNSEVYCFEPDPVNLEIGRANAELNDLELHFERAAAGSRDGGKFMYQLESEAGKTEPVKIRSVTAFADEHKLPRIDLLHMDVQGVELDALKGAEKLIAAGRLRFLFVSTHHYIFSRDVRTHQKCIDFIQRHGGHIVTSHNILESYSGDGLIVASFDKKDRDFTVETSVNTSQFSLLRPYEEDLAILLKELDG